MLCSFHALRCCMSSNSNNKIFHNSIEHFLCNPSDLFSDDVLSCLWIVFTNSVFQVTPQKIVRQVEILGVDLGQGLLVWCEMNLSHGKLCLRYSNALLEKWGTTSFQTAIFNRTLEYLRRSFLWDRLISRQTDNPWSPIPKISTLLTSFWGGYLKDKVLKNNPQTREDIIRKEIRWIAQEMLNRAVNNFIVWVAAVLSYTSAVHGTDIVLNTEKV